MSRVSGWVIAFMVVIALCLLVLVADVASAMIGNAVRSSEDGAYAVKALACCITGIVLSLLAGLVVWHTWKLCRKFARQNRRIQRQIEILKWKIGF